MAITKMSIGKSAVNLFTVRRHVLRQGGRTGDDSWLRRKIMILMSKKTNHTSNLFHATLDDHGTLADSELDAVSGGATAASRDDLILNALLAAAAKMLPRG
jgi:hypothetical protein